MTAGVLVHDASGAVTYANRAALDLITDTLIPGRVAELRAQSKEHLEALRANGEAVGPRHELAGVLRRLADRL